MKSKKLILLLVVLTCCIILFSCSTDIVNKLNIGEFFNISSDDNYNLDKPLENDDTKDVQLENNEDISHEDNDTKDDEVPIENNTSEPNISPEPVKIDDIITEPSTPIEHEDVNADSSELRYYESLIANDKVKHKIYIIVSDAIKNKSAKASIPSIDDFSTISLIFDYVILDHPEYFYAPTSYNFKKYTNTNVIEVSLEYNESVWKLSEIDNYSYEIEQIAKNIISEAKKLEGDYNKILFVYKYIIDNITYSAESVEDYTIYGALVNKKASCEGYSEAFQHLLNLLDIEAITVTGTSKGEGHQWNIVKIDDSWYYFDATWDSTGSTKPYTSYNYCGITLEEISKTHILDDNDIIPSATKNKYNYHYYNGLILSDYEEQALLNIAKKSLELTPNYITFKATNEDVYKTTLDNLSTWLQKIYTLPEVKVNKIKYTINDNLKIINIYLEHN